MAQKPITVQVLKGLLKHFMDVPVNEVNAPAIAKDRGIAVREVRTDESRDFASVLTLTVRGANGEATVSGTIFGKRDARIVRVNQFDIDAIPDGHVIVIENEDAPGVVGNVGNTLGVAGVNIARIALSRDAEKRAFSLVNIDSPAAADVLDKLRKLPHVTAVRQIRL